VKAPKIVYTWYFWLFVITGIAIVLRSLPAWIYKAWGCDFGIYYSLTNSFVETGSLFNQYGGWGLSYQYFPVLYAITGVAHWITGIDVLIIMPKFIPIFGGLSVLIFYFVVYELIGDRKTALLASLILAVLPFHVYQTSHASPLTIGHFFMMLSLYLFIKYRQDTRYIIPLSASTLLLIMSHHLTTYFYLISLIFIVFVENASKMKWTPHVKIDTAYILGTSVLIFSYWALIAKPVFDNFMNAGPKIGPFKLGATAIIPLFYVGFFFLFGMIWLKRRYKLFTYSGEPSQKRCLIIFIAALTICLSIMGVFALIQIPWTGFRFTAESIVYSLPLVLMFSLGVAGFRYLRVIRNGAFIKGWLLAIIVSLVFSIITNTSVLYPHRHFEYIMAPLSIVAIYGLRGIFLNGYYDVFSKRKGIALRIPWKTRLLSKELLSRIQNRRLAYLAIIILLIATNAISVYPSHISLNASDEEITADNLAAIDWLHQHIQRNGTTIASDHRLSRLAEAAGFNTTLDEAWDIWSATELPEYIDELYGVDKNYSMITHVIIDDIMRDVVCHVGFGIIIYISDAAYAKFQSEPFELIHRETTVDSNNEEIHWTEIYRVNWTYIEALGPITPR
jgi:hypothetical protein